MANAHRTNVLVTSCLKTPVDPHTKAPLALYEREQALPYSSAVHLDNRDYERELDYDDSGSEFGDGDAPGKSSPIMIKDYRVTGDHIDLREFYFSNEEYYRKLEELKRAHLRTMAELDSMYRKKLQLKGGQPVEVRVGSHRLPEVMLSPAPGRSLRKSHSALELRMYSGLLDLSDEEGATNSDVEKGLLSSPKEHIKNMWHDFKLSPGQHHLSSSSLHSLPGDSKSHKPPKGKGKMKPRGHKGSREEPWKPRMTVPKPFHMMLREAEKHRCGVRTRSEIELENADLRRKLVELTECQRKFRASPVPAHVHLPLYEELKERDEERRHAMRQREQQRLHTTQKPFSFLERERLKQEQREEQHRHLKPNNEERGKPFKAKPVPKAVYEAASGEQMKEDQLYRAIKMQMRAKELLLSAAMPPSMLARVESERQGTKVGASGDASASEEENGSPYKPKINKEVPDFDASYRRFQKHLDRKREVRPVTSCEPFQLRTSQIPSNRDRILADIEKDQQMSPRMTRWPYICPGPVRTPNSSLGSSLSGSLELIPAKVTDATRKRQEAVRKVLEQRRKAEEEEEKWRKRQKQREKKLQRVVSKRAQANDPHVALSQTCQSKLKEFRKQDLLRTKEYRQEIKEIQERVKGRPLLLEQVAQRNAKQAAEKRYRDALQSCGLSDDMVSGMVPKSLSLISCGSAHKASLSGDSKQSDDEEYDAPVCYSKIYLDDDYPDDYEDFDQEQEEGRDAEMDQYKSKKNEDEDRDEADLSEKERVDNDHYSGDDNDAHCDQQSDSGSHLSDDSEHTFSRVEKNQQ
ncbi:protein FAM161A [Aplochiton taeniatus]